MKLQWITNDTARRTTYKKRVKGLMKKAKELSVLCGVQVCTVVYSPYDPQPEVWPSPKESARVIGDFKCRPENDQTKKKLDQENYTRQRLVKANGQVEKQQKKNRKMEMENVMNQSLAGGNVLHELSIKQCSDLMWAIDDRLKEIGYQMEQFHDHHPAAAAPAHTLGGSGGGAAAAAGPVSENTALEAALKSLENQMLMETAAPVVQSANSTQVMSAVGYVPGGQEMVVPGLYGQYEDPSFQGPPFYV